jgi:urease accessory protein
LTLHPTNPINRHGELRLTFARRGAGDSAVTVLTERYFKTPLQVMRAVEDAAGVLTVYLLSPTGGVVQGDHYQIDVTVGEGAHAFITTQAATKVYRMPEHGASQCVQIEVLPGAVLEFLPDALILFAEADYAQEMHITLHPGALLMLQEIVMPGRLARGEVLKFKRYKNRVIVRDPGGLLLYDSVDYAPQDGDVSRLGLLDGYPCWGSWYLLGDLAAWQTDPAAFCAQHHDAVVTMSDAVGGFSPTFSGGLSARVVARTLSPIYTTFNLLWAAVRAEVLHLPPSTIRK